MHKSINTNQQLRSRQEAADYLGVAPQTLAVWASTKRYNLPIVKIGRHVKYRQADLDAFIERNVVGGGCSDDGDGIALRATR